MHVQTWTYACSKASLPPLKKSLKYVNGGRMEAWGHLVLEMTQCHLYFPLIRKTSSIDEVGVDTVSRRKDCKAKFQKSWIWKREELAKTLNLLFLWWCVKFSHHCSNFLQTWWLRITELRSLCSVFWKADLESMLVDWNRAAAELFSFAGYLGKFISHDVYFLLVANTAWVVVLSLSYHFLLFYCVFCLWNICFSLERLVWLHLDIIWILLYYTEAPNLNLSIY